MAVHSSSRTLYAIKVVPKSKIATQKQIRQLVSEVHILKLAIIMCLMVCQTVIFFRHYQTSESSILCVFTGMYSNDAVLIM